VLPKVRYETQGNTVRAVEPLVDGQPDRVRDSHGRPVVLLRRRHDRACVAAANARGNLHYSPGLHREGSITIKLNFFCGVCGYVALGMRFNCEDAPKRLRCHIIPIRGFGSREVWYGLVVKRSPIGFSPGLPVIND